MINLNKIKRAKTAPQDSTYQIATLDGQTDGYTGDVAPKECWAALEAVPESALIDVRTQAEWAFVGLPNLHSLGKDTHRIEWQCFPSMALNENFTTELQTSVPNKTAPVFFICRSGQRSASAAQAAQKIGYAHSYNVAGGFEGDADADGHRGQLNGWKKENCAWYQA